ncbi:MAG: cation:proton antiporter [Candidatus Methanofastidiosa archaeon]|nr:cation:proton antiporter [Candidatus Methanofastidiosa archaeon]
MIDLTNILLIFLFAKVFGDLSEKGNISGIVGHVLCGIILGPFLLGIIYPSKEIEVLADIGLLVIMLYAGLTSEYKELLKAKYTAVLVGALGVLFSFVMCFSIVWLLGFGLIPSLFTGIILSNTAVEIIGGLITNENNQKVSNILLGASFFDDIIAIYLVGLLSSIAINKSTLSIVDIGSVTLKIFVFFVITILLSEFLISSKGPKITKYFVEGDQHQSIMLVFIFTLVFALFASFIGLHEVVGSFLAGLILSRVKEREDPMLSFRIRFNEITGEMNTLMRFFFMPLFFVYIGLLFNRENKEINIILITLLFLAAMSGKIIGCGLGSKISRLTNRDSIIVGVGMCGRGSLELAIVRYGFTNGVISNEIYSSIVILTLLTIIITPILFRKLMQKSDVYFYDISVP